MEEVGQRFQRGEAFVPNLLMAARAMKGSLDILKPLMKGDASTSLGKVVIGTVKGDLHDIGKNLVASMLEGCGFEVINLGVDVGEREIYRSRQGKQGRYPLSLGAADHHDELYERGDRRFAGRR